MAEAKKPRSLSTWIGCGCAAVVALFMLAVLAITLFTYRAGKDLQAMAEDPERAAEAVRAVLPYRQLPPGYAPVGTLSVPVVMDVAFLGGPEATTAEATPGATDDAASDDGDELRHAFIWVRVRDWFGRGQRSRDWLSGDAADGSPIEQNEMSFEPRETFSRGELDAGGAHLVWLSRRGAASVDTTRLGSQRKGAGDDREPWPVVLTMFAADCPTADGWERIGIWFEPDPAPERPAAEVDWSGTPADPDRLRDFLAAFDLCA